MFFPDLSLLLGRGIRVPQVKNVFLQLGFQLRSVKNLIGVYSNNISCRIVCKNNILYLRINSFLPQIFSSKSSCRLNNSSFDLGIIFRGHNQFSFLGSVNKTRMEKKGELGNRLSRMGGVA